MGPVRKAEKADMTEAVAQSPEGSMEKAVNARNLRNWGFTSAHITQGE